MRPLNDGVEEAMSRIGLVSTIRHNKEGGRVYIHIKIRSATTWHKSKGAGGCPATFAMRGRPGTSRIREVPEGEDWNLTQGWVVGYVGWSRPLHV